MGKSYNDILMKKLDSPEKITEYLNALVEDCFNDDELSEKDATGIIMDAIGKIIKYQGVNKLAGSANLNRDTIYKAFNQNGNPSFATLYKTCKALGLKLSFAA